MVFLEVKILNFSIACLICAFYWTQAKLTVYSFFSGIKDFFFNPLYHSWAWNHISRFPNHIYKSLIQSPLFLLYIRFRYQVKLGSKSDSSRFVQLNISKYFCITIELMIIYWNGKKHCLKYVECFFSTYIPISLFHNLNL